MLVVGLGRSGMAAADGLLECDEFRRRLLTDVASQAGRTGFTVAPDTSVAQVRQQQLDLLGDLVEQHLDIDAVLALIDNGAPAGLRQVSVSLA